jgi:short-subunit dehydrogenase
MFYFRLKLYSAMNALITGATKGIGKAIAFKLASAGYNLAICSRNLNDIEQVKAELSQVNPLITVIGIPTDCAELKQLHSFINFVRQHFDILDVLINNVGTYIPGSIFDEEDDNLSLQMKLNLESAFYLSKVFGKQMRENKSGHIINICSVAAVRPVVQAGSYTVTKFALLGLTRVLREELMPFNVKVTAVIPGSTLTESWDGESVNPERFILPADVAEAVLNCLQLSKGCNIDELIIRPVGGEV